MNKITSDKTISRTKSCPTTRLPTAYPQETLSIIVAEKTKLSMISGKVGQTAKFGQRPCLFHISNIEIENELTKQTVIILI